MSANDPPQAVINVAAEIARFFDDSSLAGGQEPELALILGGVAVGKTRLRRERYSRGYVVVDAGDIFIKLSRNQYLDFPSSLESPLEIIGAAVAQRAVQERRNIVCELIGADLEPLQRLSQTFKSIG